jgi:hypothetical protein
VLPNFRRAYHEWRRGGLSRSVGAGRVDLVLLPDQSAVVSWLEQTNNGGDIRLRRVRADGRRGKSFALTPTSTKRASGFPRMVRNNDEIVFAWTQLDSNSTTVRTAVAKATGD